MKKAFLAAAFFAFAANQAQITTTTTTTTTAAGETKTASVTSVYDKKITVSAFGSFPELNQAGLSVEFLGNTETKSMNSKSFSFYSSKVVNAAYAMMNYEVSLPGGDDVDGSGFVVEIGQRNYFLGKNSGPYMGNYLSYGNIKFDEDGFDGTYSYFSFFSPEVGYKIKLGGLAVDPFAGMMWKLEIKGKGDIDNRYVEEWTPRIGLKIGYQF